MRLPCALLALLLAAPTVAPQGAEVPGVKVELVQVDVVVRDAGGRLVRDLDQKDFELLEDGQRQAITHFAVTRAPARRTAAAPPDPAATPAVAPAAPPAAEASAAPGRHVVIIVDDLHIAPGNLPFAREALTRFVAESIVPGDSVALVTTGAPPVVQQATSDPAVLGEAIGRLRAREAVTPSTRGSDMTPAQAEMVLAGDRQARQLAGRTMITEPGNVYETAGPRSAAEGAGGAAASAAAGAASDPEAKQRAAEQEAERQARGVLAEALRFSRATLGTIDDVLRGLAPKPGRKLCLLVSDGFLVGAGTSEERTRELQGIVDAATRAGAVVYSLDSRGLTTTGGDASTTGSVDPGLRARVDRQAELRMRTTLETVANDTGGFLVTGSNALADGLRRMLDDNETYYLLAYQPANTRRDGRFRRIQVQVAGRPGVTVRTRKGYFAPDDRRPAPAQRAAVTGALGLDEAAARAVLAAALPADGIPVRMTADFVDLPPAGSQVVVRAQVDVSGIRWQQSKGRRLATIDLVGGITDAEGRPVGAPFGRRAELDLAPEEHKRAMEAGVRYEHAAVLGPGRYEVRFLARQSTPDRLGGAKTSVEVPDLSGKTLALSGVFLSSAAPAPGAAAGTAGETLRDVHVQRRFRKGESLYFQLYVYNVARDAAGATDVVLQAQLWSEGKVIAASKPEPVRLQTKDGTPLPETNSLPLDGLAPGPYELRLVVVDRKAKVQTARRVDFTLE
jgi:VWFA-related protein